MPTPDIFGLQYNDYTRDGLDLRTSEVVRLVRRDANIGDETIDTWIVLGTGWGDEVELEVDFEAELQNFSIFRVLPSHPTHKRLLQIGWMMVNGQRKRVGVVRGRIHLNDNNFMPGVIRLMVRLQHDFMIKMGAKNIILTASCGTCHGGVPIRKIVVAKKFLAFGGSEALPVYGGEFNAPETALNTSVIDQLDTADFPLVNHMFWLGPHFENAEDKANMAKVGADVVGMSLKAALTIVAAHLERRKRDPTHWCDPDLRVIPLVYTSNGYDDHPDDTEIRRRAHEDAGLMASALETSLRLCT
ncbi:MAG: hypothetical protein P8J32_02385 [bacterium]|jgi:purine nucleoside phosphorylase|nr:hypothetical protein [bacterium]